MKRNLLLMMLGLLALSSCSKTEGDEIAPTPENVEFTINFGFAESGSMSRSGASAYDDFYTKYIVTKELTPDTYSLTFRQGDNVIATVSGSWGSADIITLPAGTYTVTGTSGSDYINGYNHNYSEKTILTFNQEIEILESTTNVNLTAIYDCLLIILNSTDISSPKYNLYSTSVHDTYSYDLYSKDNIFYIFLEDSPSSFPWTDYITYYGESGGGRLDLDDLNLEKGNYYYYDVATGSFDIPPMTAGN